MPKFRIHARQAIATTYHGPTNTRGGRITARADAGKITVPWDHSLGIEENYARAARELVKKLGWGGRWVMGSNPGADYVFCLADPGTSFTVKVKAELA